MKKAAVPPVSKKTRKRVRKKPAACAVQKKTMKKAIKKAAAPAASKKMASSAARKKAMKQAMNKALAPAAPKKAIKKARKKAVAPTSKKWEAFVKRHYINKGRTIPDSECAWQVAKSRFLGWPLPNPKQLSTAELCLHEAHIHGKTRAHLHEWTGTARTKRWRKELLVPTTTCVLSLTSTKANSDNELAVDEKASGETNNPALNQPKKSASVKKSGGETKNPASDEILGDEGSDADADNAPLASLLSGQVAFATGQGVSSLPTAKVCPS